MTNKFFLNRHKFIIPVILLAVVALTLGIKNLIEAKKQEVIHATPWDVIESFQNAGYQVSNIIENDEYQGPLGPIGYHIRFDIQSANSTYGVRIIQYETWKGAQKAAKYIVDLDKKMNGNLAYAFSYGEVLIEFWPSDRNFGDQLLVALEASE